MRWSCRRRTAEDWDDDGRRVKETLDYAQNGMCKCYGCATEVGYQLSTATLILEWASESNLEVLTQRCGYALNTFAPGGAHVTHALAGSGSVGTTNDVAPPCEL